MRNMVIGKLVNGVYKIDGVDQEIKARKNNPSKEIFLQLREREKRFYNGQTVKHNGETYVIESVSKNGWVNFVGVEPRTRIQYIEAVEKEMESYYGIPSNTEIVRMLKKELQTLSKYNVIDFIFSFKKTIKNMIVLINTMY